MQFLVFAQGAEVGTECVCVLFPVEVWDVVFCACGAGRYGECVVEFEVNEFDCDVVCAELFLDVGNGCRIVVVVVVVLECDCEWSVVDE